MCCDDSPPIPYLLDLRFTLRVIGRWKDFDHFLKTTQVYRDDFTALAAANAFGGFGISRSEAIWKAEAAPFRRLLDIKDRKINWNHETKMQQIQRDFHSFK